MSAWALPTSIPGFFLFIFFPSIPPFYIIGNIHMCKVFRKNGVFSALELLLVVQKTASHRSDCRPTFRLGKTLSAIFIVRTEGV